MRPWYMPPSNAVPVTIFRGEEERKEFDGQFDCSTARVSHNNRNVKVKKSFEKRNKGGRKKECGCKSRIARTFCAV